MSVLPLADLHLHSDRSDGRLDPAALVSFAAARGVGHLALTDHDTVEGLDAAAAACAAQGLRFSAGVEVTALWRGQSLHVIGLGLRADEAELGAHLAAVRERRRQRLREIGERLARRGRLPDAVAIVERICATAAVPTRTHLARALVEAGAAEGLDEAFRRLLGRGAPGHVPADWPTLEATVAVLRGAGAQVVLAHPHRYRLSAGALRNLCAEFRECGGAALETSLPALSPNDAARLASLAREHQLAGSVGSDFHEPGQPWRPLGRFAKLAEGVEPLLPRLRVTGEK